MIELDYIIPPWSFQEWYALSLSDQIQVESPPKHLHLELDITKLTRSDIEWIERSCSHIIPELNKLFDEHNQKNKQYQSYQESIRSYEKKIKVPKIIQKQRIKAPKVYQ